MRKARVLLAGLTVGAVAAMVAAFHVSPHATLSVPPPTVVKRPPSVGCSGLCGPPPWLAAARRATRVPGAVTGGTIRVLSADDITSLDPRTAPDRALQSILSDLVLRSLTHNVYDPRTRHQVLIPDLATNLGVPSSDFHQWEYTIVRGETFATGAPITVADVVRGLRAGCLAQRIPLVSVRMRAWNITLRFSRPTPDLPFQLDSPVFTPLLAGPSASAPAVPVASGPYRVGSFEPGRRLTLVRNTAWRQRLDVGRAAYADRFQFVFGMDQRQIDAALLTDGSTARTTVSSGSASTGQISAFRTRAPGRIVSGTSNCVDSVGIDMNAVPNIAVRRAIGWAYPYAAEAMASGEPSAFAGVGDNPLPPGALGRIGTQALPGHRPGLTDAAHARRLLADAHALHPTIRLGDQPGVGYRPAERAILAHALRAAGFDPILVSTGEVALRTERECASTAFPRSWVVDRFGSDGSTNDAGFSSSWLDTLLQRSAVLPLAKQPSYFNWLATRIERTRYPVIVTGYGQVVLPHGDRIGGEVVDTLLGTPDWSRLWVRP